MNGMFTGDFESWIKKNTAMSEPYNQGYMKGLYGGMNKIAGKEELPSSIQSSMGRNTYATNLSNMMQGFNANNEPNPWNQLFGRSFENMVDPATGGSGMGGIAGGTVTPGTSGIPSGWGNLFSTNNLVGLGSYGAQRGLRAAGAPKWTGDIAATPGKYMQLMDLFGKLGMGGGTPGFGGLFGGAGAAGAGAADAVSAGIGGLGAAGAGAAEAGALGAAAAAPMVGAGAGAAGAGIGAGTAAAATPALAAAGPPGWIALAVIAADLARKYLGEPLLKKAGGGSLSNLIFPIKLFG